MLLNDDLFEGISVIEQHRTVPFPPGEALLELYQQRGPVTNVGFRGRKCVLLLGAEANEFVFANADAFSWRAAFEPLTLVDGPAALIVSDGTDHRRRRSVVTPALQHRRVGEQVQTMVDHTDSVIDSWRPGQRIEIYEQLRSAVRRSTVECLFGSRLAVYADFLGEQLQPLIDLTNLRPRRRQLHRRVGSPTWRRALAARSRIHDLIDGQIADARAHPKADDRLLATLLSGRGSLSDDEIRDMVVSLIADGYEVTSGAVAWAIHALLTIPGAWDTATAEVRRKLGWRPPTAESLNELTYLNGVVHETLRLYTTNSARKATRDLQFHGHRIRAGQRLIFSAYVTHRLPELWPQPYEFRPQRWDPGSPFYRKPGLNEFIPFSRGLHRCVGSVMAITQMTVTLARLVAKTTLRLPAQSICAHNAAALRPYPGLTVELVGQAQRCR